MKRENVRVALLAIAAMLAFVFPLMWLLKLPQIEMLPMLTPGAFEERSFEDSLAVATVKHSLTVRFSPNGGCQDAIIREISVATKSIRILQYTFTSAPIAESLVAAAKRGCNVEVILDNDEASHRYSMAETLTAGGVTVFVDGSHAIAHNKVAVIDGRTVLTGSFNWTVAAEKRNAENLLVVRNETLALSYLLDYAEHRKHSIPWAKK